MREVTVADAVELSKLEDELFEDGLSAAALAAELACGYGWLIEGGGVIQAYVLVREDYWLLDITRFGTRTAFQGQGLGSSLLKRVLEDPKPVMLTVDHENAVAFKMYQKLGFKVAGELADGSLVLRLDR